MIHKIAAAFRLAIDLTQEQVGATAPNPAVGCVLLESAGDVLIAADHLGAGQPDAEARTIQMAGDAGLTARIDKVIITVEPGRAARPS